MKKYTPFLGILSVAHIVMAGLKRMVSTVLVDAVINVPVAIVLIAADITYLSVSLTL